MATDARVTHGVVEAAGQTTVTASILRVTHVPVEVAEQVSPSTIHLTHSVVEALQQIAVGVLRVTHAVVEVVFPFTCAGGTPPPVGCILVQGLEPGNAGESGCLPANPGSVSGEPGCLSPNPGSV